MTEEQKVVTQDLIDRDDARKHICKYCAEWSCKGEKCMVYAGLKDTPTIQTRTFANDTNVGRKI